jgi:membrane-associated protein
MLTIIDVFLHLDTHLQAIIAQYGTLTYAILFAIIFCETGLVVMPFLPGDSLLFAAGTFAAKGSFNLVFLIVLLLVAAILGDTVNYFIGKKIGTRAFSENRRWLNKEHLLMTQRFYEKHGAKAIIFARFLPIVRTIAPFVAGVGSMHYATFFFYNVLGGVIWVVLFTCLGYFFGNIPAVEHNFTLVIFAMIGLSFLPTIIHLIRYHFLGKKGEGEGIV